MTINQSYYSALAQVESGNNQYAKARTSSASGLYQFTQSTWKSLGYDWNDVFNTDLQHQAIAKLTQQNASVLSKNNIPIDGGSLYGAHFLGAGTAVDVYSADDNAPISSVVSSGVMKANPFLKGMSVGDFKDWASNKISNAGGVISDAVSSVKNTVSKVKDTVSKAKDIAGKGAEVAAAVESGNPLP